MNAPLPPEQNTTKLNGLLDRTRQIVGAAPSECFSDVAWDRALDGMSIVRDLLGAKTVARGEMLLGLRWVHLFDLLQGDEQDALAAECERIRECVAEAAPLGEAIRALEATLQSILDAIGQELDQQLEGEMLTELSEKHYALNDRLRALRTLDSARGNAKPNTSRDASPTRTASRDDGDGDGEVFIVHGHDAALREEVARFIHVVTGAVPLILHEKANQGKTIIEKLEARTQRAKFAVVLLTRDDEGRERGGDELKDRGRQNVVFEFGFFIGLLGRSATAILYEPEVELPSDLNGLVYIERDVSGGWKLQLANELKSAGLSVDLNRAIS